MIFRPYFWKHCAWLVVDTVLSVPRTWLIVRFPEVADRQFVQA